MQCVAHRLLVGAQAAQALALSLGLRRCSKDLSRPPPHRMLALPATACAQVPGAGGPAGGAPVCGGHLPAEQRARQRQLDLPVLELHAAGGCAVSGVLARACWWVQELLPRGRLCVEARVHVAAGAGS